MGKPKNSSAELIKEIEILRKENEFLKKELNFKKPITQPNDIGLLFVDNLKENPAEERKFWLRVLDNIPIIIYIAKNEKIVKINSAAETIMGYTPDECYSFETLKDIFHPDDWNLFLQKARDEIEELTSGTKIISGQYRMRHKDGSMKWLDYTRALFETDNDSRTIYTIGTASDITARKNAEEALLKSEEKYRTLVEQIPIGIYRTTLDGKVIHANQALAKILEYYCVDELLKVYVPHTFVKELDREIFLNEVTNDDNLIIHEHNLKTKNNNLIFVRDTCKPIRDENQQIIYLDGIIEDITNIHQAEAALKQALNDKQIILDNITHLVSYHDINLNYLWINRAYSKAFDIKSEELIGHCCYKILYKRTQQCENCPVIKSIETKKKQEIEMAGNNGDNRIWHIIANPILNSDGEVEGIIEVILDITEKKLAERALSDSEEKFRSIVETANEGIIILDKDDKITFINRRIIEMFGYKPNEMIGNNLYDFKFGSDKILDRAKKNLENKRIVNDQRFRRKDGSELWVIISSTPIYNQKDRISGSFSLLNDITERKQAEVQLIRYAEELLNSKELLEENSKELAILNEQLLKSEKKLKDLNDTKDKFFTLIAHDLKNPFGILLHFSKVLSENFNDYNDKEKQKFLSEIYHSTDQAYKLLENLLEWSRSQTGKIKFEPQEVDLSAIAFNCIYLFKNISENKKINIISYLNNNTIVFADYNMVNTIFRNIVSNAVKFTNIGGNIKITSQALHGFIEISVSDDGIGMDANTLSKLFHIDTKSVKLGTKGESGTGLGLILCKEFIERNKGEISVESEKGKGSTFRFKLPVHN